MSSYSYASLINVWIALAAVVVALVATRAVAVVPTGGVAIVAILAACPMFDAGFFWIEWGSADGTPGQGLWTAILFAVSGMCLLYASASQSNKTTRGKADTSIVEPSAR